MEPFFKTNDHRYKVVDSKESLLKFEDTDIESEFYFDIKDSQFANSKTHFIIEYKPKNKDTTSHYQIKVEKLQFEAHFKMWTNFLIDYDKVETPFDDPILKKNEERFIQQFDILDKDAETVSFDLEQQLFLQEYLDDAKNKLIQLKEGKSKEEIIEIETLEADADGIKKVLTKETKRKIIKRLSKFWGKAQKLGLEIIKEIFINVATELTKKLMTGQ